MSIEAQAFVWGSVCEDEEITSTQRFIMMSLSNHSNSEDDYVCNVSLSTLARKTGLNVMTVSRNLDILSKTKYLEKTNNFDKKGRKIKNSYRLKAVEVALDSMHNALDSMHNQYNIYTKDIYSIKDNKSLKDISSIPTNNPYIKYIPDTYIEYIPSILNNKLDLNNTLLYSKKISEDSNEKYDFEKLWFSYPPTRRGDKKRARKKFHEHNRKILQEQICYAVWNYLYSYFLEKNDDITYLKLLSTFLNTELIPWLTPEQHPHGEFNPEHYQKFKIPKKYIGNSHNLNPEYVLWESNKKIQEMKK